MYSPRACHIEHVGYDPYMLVPLAAARNNFAAMLRLLTGYNSITGVDQVGR
jgi:hypothetical protein